jgi:tRNA A37 threonylcarbamoyltransferase TsaD
MSNLNDICASIQRTLQKCSTKICAKQPRQHKINHIAVAGGLPIVVYGNTQRDMIKRDGMFLYQPLNTVPIMLE